MKNLILLASLGTLTVSSPAFGQDIYMPYSEACCSLDSGFFVGLGGSYNSVNLNRHLRTSGSIEAVADGVVVATGSIGGGLPRHHETVSTFAPVIQAGYFSQICCTEHLWGFKFAYKYLGVTFTHDDLHSRNRLLTADDIVAVGGVSIDSAQTSVDHQLDFLLLYGYNVGQSRLYIGAGPVVFGTYTKLYHVNGFVDIADEDTDVFFGRDVNFSQANWIWGGIAEVGLLYHFDDPSWFVDFNYSYAITGKYTKEGSSPFVNRSNGFRNQGDINVQQRTWVASQAFSVSINKAF